MQAMTLIPTKKITREEWLAYRRKGVGGSDAAAIMGVHPYKSALAVYYDKLGLSPERETTEAMRQGVDLEGYVADRFCERTGLRVRRVNRILAHPERPWMLANIDREVVGAPIGLECKTTSVYNKTRFDENVVPPEYYWQCMHYMAVTGWKVWYLAVLVLNRSFHIYRIDWDEVAGSALVERERAFWHDSVLAEAPPLPSGSEDEDEMLRAICAPRDEIADPINLQSVQDTLDILPLLEREKKDAETRLRQAKQRVALALGNNPRGFATGWNITNTVQVRRTVDDARLKAERADVYNAYVKTTSYPVLRVSKFKEVQ